MFLAIRRQGSRRTQAGCNTDVENGVVTAAMRFVLWLEIGGGTFLNDNVVCVLRSCRIGFVAGLADQACNDPIVVVEEGA
jgi:hypothetical protein